ncbi:uncharacterized protein zgc:112970 [Nerophis ophidion]|uniref:uncharacterized protein zgc:112970 n=1 Tax=Nerophis ophidion TaxID=159077 RepID=UPI002ADF0F61|nr:uncharacterized protein zgc:112970 [Nerophis ophidion]
MKIIADIIQSIADKVDAATTFNICVTRDQMLERGMKLWQRQNKSSPKNLTVSFIGEAGIDSGALRKEFLTEMLAGIERRFFEGGIDGKVPKYSMTDFEKYNFRTIGEIFAVSLAQGGPPPNFLMHWCYIYISTGEFDLGSITEKDVVDLELIELIKEFYTIVRLLPMLQQTSSGMKLYDLLTLVQQENNICRQLFVPGSFGKVDADFLVQSLSPVFSEIGTMRHQRESTVVNFLQDFVQAMEDEGKRMNTTQRPEKKMRSTRLKNKTMRHINVGKFCQWLTGQSHIPLSYAERKHFKMVMEFDHDCEVRYGANHTICYPVVNACSCSVSFPVAHLRTYAEFKTVLSQAIVNGFEFSRY